MLARVCGAVLFACAAACSPAAKQSAPPSAQQTALPTVNAEDIIANLSMDDMLEVLNFEAHGATTISGEVSGYRSKVWAVPVAAGQTLAISFDTTSTNLYFNVRNATDDSGAAVHRGDIDGPTASITAAQDAVYLIEPYQPRASARRGEADMYTLTVSRS